MSSVGRPFGLQPCDIAAARALGGGRPLWQGLTVQALGQPARQQLWGSRNEAWELQGIMWASSAGDWHDVLDVVVAAAARREGHGRALVQAACQAAAQAGALGVTLEVAIDNEPAFALYRSVGFVVVHTRRGYYRQGHKLVDALVMSWSTPGSVQTQG